MGDAPENVLLRFGDWFAKYQHKYSMQIENLRVEQSGNGYNEQSIRFIRMPVSVVPADMMLQMLRDYDKYLDDNLVL